MSMLFFVWVWRCWSSRLETLWSCLSYGFKWLLVKNEKAPSGRLVLCVINKSASLGRVMGANVGGVEFFQQSRYEGAVYGT